MAKRVPGRRMTMSKRISMFFMSCRRRHTTWTGDWSSDVCSSDLGQFTGEVNMLSARRSLVRGRVREDGSIIVVDRNDLRTLVSRDFELSEILMRAFILRRVAQIGRASCRERVENTVSPVAPRT